MVSGSKVRVSIEGATKNGIDCYRNRERLSSRLEDYFKRLLFNLLRKLSGKDTGQLAEIAE